MFPLFLGPKAGSLWPLSTCLKSYGGITLGTPQGSQETLTAGLVGPRQTQGLQRKPTLASWDQLQSGGGEAGEP